jgi:DNA-directed RNA polymerase specialized sigma24 family protein
VIDERSCAPNSSPARACARGAAVERRAAGEARFEGRHTCVHGALQRHHQALYRYCRSIVRDEDDAQDALQSAMMRALAALQARERDLAVRPWLFRIVHNEAVSILRRRRPDVSLVEGLEPADGGVERTLEQRERFAALIADLQALAERQRGCRCPRLPRPRCWRDCSLMEPAAAMPEG